MSEFPPWWTAVNGELRMADHILTLSIDIVDAVKQQLLRNKGGVKLVRRIDDLHERLTIVRSCIKDAQTKAGGIIAPAVSKELE